MAQRTGQKFASRALVLSTACAASLAIGFCLLVGTAREEVEPERVQGSAAASESGEARASEIEPPQPQPAEHEPLDLEPLELEIAESDPVESRQAVPELPPEAKRSLWDGPNLVAGRLRVRAVDSEGVLPLDLIRVRAMSDRRIADRRSDRGTAAVQVVLTPDVYSLIVLSPGYEPAELPPVQIPLHGDVVLDTVRMQAGRARIFGVIHGERPSDRALSVELTGEGRRPCASCWTRPDPADANPSASAGGWVRPSPCPRCGYAEKYSRTPVTGTGTFEFRNLAGGTYAVRVIDAQDRTIDLPKFVELPPGGSLPMELTAAPLRTVRVELIDTDGSSLARPWAERSRRRGASASEDDWETVVVESATPRRIFQCKFRVDDLGLAHAVLVPPPMPGYTAVGVGAFCGRRLGHGGRKGVHDRPRWTSETLRGELPVPVIATFQVQAGVDADGFARFESVPGTQLSLDFESGPFRATATIPPSGGEIRVRAELKRETGSASAEDAGTPMARTFLEFESGSGR